MHEISLMYSILKIAKQTAIENQITSISKIKLVIGTNLLVMPDALQFAFDHMKEKPFDLNAELEWEEREGRDFYIDYIEGE